MTPKHMPQPPPSWTNPELQEMQCTFVMDVLTALAVHGAVALAVKHPQIGACARERLETVLARLELKFEEVGLERPETGWRP